ncbi:unnamed protein product [Cylicocyclus nassatus]|uniref:Uncharacterized protein n=1 Tax=Cylicocyclus nassatus TaxID=53992 RepID=A0AA36GQJ6_CYLNA|nr:unnamed protein product [Cylicocyclus nassatus]
MTPISYIILCIAVWTIKGEKCTDKDFNVDLRVSEHGSMESFYSIANGICDGIQSKLSEAAVTDLHNTLKEEDLKDASSTIIDRLAKNQIGSIVFCLVGIVIGVCSLGFGITILCMRCLCNHRRNAYASEYADDVLSVFTQLLLLIFLMVAFSLLIAGVVLNNKSSSGLFSSTETSQGTLKLIMGDALELYNNATATLICTFDEVVDKTLNEVEENVKTAPELLVDDFKNMTEISRLDQMDTNATQQEVNSCRTQCTSINGTIQGVLQKSPERSCELKLKGTKKIIDVLYEQLEIIEKVLSFKNTTDSTTEQIYETLNDTTESYVGSSIEQVRSRWNDVRTTVEDSKEVSNTLEDFEKKIDNILDDVFSSKIYKSIKQGFSWIVTIPGIITLLLALVASMPLILYMCFPQARYTAVVHFLFQFSLYGFYAITIFACLVIILSSVEYLFVSMTSTGCKTLFQDSSYSSLTSLQKEVQLVEGYHLNLSLRDTLTSSKKDVTLWKAIKADSVFDTDTVLDIVNLESIKNSTLEMIDDVRQEVFKFQEDIRPNKDDAFKIMNEMEALLRNLTQFYTLSECSNRFPNETKKIEQGVASINSSMHFFQKDMRVVGSVLETVINIDNNTLDEKLETTHSNVLNLVEQPVRRGIESVLNDLSSKLLPARAVYNLYQNFGSLFCSDIAKPAHGVWASSGLCGLSILFAAIIILLITRMDDY